MSQELHTHYPRVLTIAGSDSGGGAGIQADLHTLHALGVHGCSVISAITAQNSVAVKMVDPVLMQSFCAQIDALGVDLPPAAIKIGLDALEQTWPMLGAPALVTDANQVVILSSQPQWRYTSLAPLPTERRGEGQRDVAVQIQGVWVRPGDWLYADADGIVVSTQPLAA